MDAVLAAYKDRTVALELALSETDKAIVKREESKTLLQACIRERCRLNFNGTPYKVESLPLLVEMEAKRVQELRTDRARIVADLDAWSQDYRAAMREQLRSVVGAPQPPQPPEPPPPPYSEGCQPAN